MSAKPQPKLFLDACRGIYIPRDFANCIIRDCISYPTGSASDLDADLETLKAGPEGEAYWEAWQDMTDSLYVHEPQGNGTTADYTLYQDGDLWLIPVGMEWSDEERWFVWPDESEAEAES